MPTSMPRGLLLFFAFCLAASFGGDGSAYAATRTEIYQATAPVADRSDAAQLAAFQAAMKIVLVRATGRRSADQESAFAPLYSNARRYVQQYRAAPDGQLWVAFDGPAIERWLTQNSQPLWGRERPATFVWLGVAGAGGAGTSGGGSVVTAGDTSDLKQAVDAAAAARGIALVWPSAADLQRTHVDFAALSQGAGGPLAGVPSVGGSGAGGSGAIASLVELGRRLGGDGVLVGRANNSGAAAAVHWSFVFQDHGGDATGAIEGVNRAADTYAGLYAASGSLAPVDIEVAGIADLKDYAAVQGYLESLNFVTHVSVEGLSGAAVRYRLTTRGGAESLQHALALNGRLQSLPADKGVQRFEYRHAP